MAVSENDQEMLEGYLDDALDAREGEAVRARLAGDGELVAALEQIRGERAMRQSLFAALEPDNAAVGALVSRVRRDVRRRRHVAAWLRPARLAAAAAACIAMGFFARGLFDRPQSSNTGLPGSTVSQTSKPGVDVQKVTGYQVTLRDDAGRVVAVQRFDSFDKAQEFAADLARWQARSERLAVGHFVLTADRF
jgi:hypothetical protein